MNKSEIQTSENIVQQLRVAMITILKFRTHACVKKIVKVHKIIPILVLRTVIVIHTCSYFCTYNTKLLTADTSLTIVIAWW